MDESDARPTGAPSTGADGEGGTTGPRRPTVVGVGASAGGLAALKTLFEHVPEGSGLTFVVVVHLSPEHESHLAELLQPHVGMPVEQVTETVRLQPDRVYVIPPGCNLSAVDTHLRLSDIEEDRRNRAPIDHFFRTLAQTHDGHSVGVVLTGTGSDGTLGVRDVKEEGGLVIVQDPAEAEHDGMPQSAIATGLVDLVLSLAEIPGAVLRFARTAPRVTVPADGEDAGGDDGQLLRQVFAELRARTGRDFGRYKPSTILRRIARRMQLAHVEDLAAYLERLRADPDEARALADDFLIHVTRFFRDPEVFEGLAADVVPGLFEGKDAGDDVRVWSVGCATGEEAYSLAILLLEEAGRRAAAGPLPRLQVFASDLHEGSLHRAREGFYPGDIEADVGADRLDRFFQKEDGGYRVRPEVRELVVFAPHNLLGDPPFSRIDLVACRNVLIYLQRDVQHDVAALFHYALRPGGALSVGTSESVGPSGLFREEDKGLGLYRRRDVPAPEQRLPVFPLARPRPPTGVRPAPPEPLAAGALHQRLVERVAPPSLLVGPDDRVAHFSAHAGRYLVHPGGEPTTSVFGIAREELGLALRAAVHGARVRGAAVRSGPVSVRLDGDLVPVVVDARPAPDPADEGYVLVLFDERAAPEAMEDAADSADAAGDGSGTRVRSLEAELDRARQHLQAVVEGHDADRAGMRASHEELQSTNEELRSTMEELETSKEELQSMNEELQAVGQENRHKVDELRQLSGDLQNLLSATDIATLFLDRDLRILRFTPRVAELFNVRPADRGRPLSDLTHRLGSDALLADARAVLETLAPAEREVEDDDGRWYLTRVLPYRSVEDRIEGVVVTFVEITTRKAMEDAVRRANDTLEDRVEKRTAEVRALAARLTVVEQEERHRIAQVLHDDLQQLLAGIGMKVEMASRSLQASGGHALAEDLDRVGEWVERALATTRTLTVDLSPPVLKGDGLVDALRWLERPMAELHGLTVTVEADGPVHVADEAVRVLLFQVVRELLFNVTKHAGVDRATVRLTEEPAPGDARGAGRLVVHVVDEGRGFDAAEPAAPGAAGGFGLSSVRERLVFLGGRLDVRSRPGEGTHAEVHVPAPLWSSPPATTPSA